MILALLLVLGALSMDQGLNFTVETSSVGAPAQYRDSEWTTGAGGYDAINSRGKRRAPPANVVREDVLLKSGRRTRLQTGAQDLVRNFALAGWMIRRHLDYVALFDFHSRNEQASIGGLSRDEARDLDNQIERLMKEDARRDRCDVAGRFRREKMFRLAEIRRTTDGDVGLMLLGDGRLQGIEADCIRNPTEEDLEGTRFRGNGDPTEWVDGFRVGTGGRTLAAAIHRRGVGGQGYKLQRIVPMRNLIHYGHFNRFASDQTRGVTPITSSMNHLRDVYEGVDLTLARMKVDQLFAMAIYRDAEDALGEIGEDSPETEDEEGNTQGPRYNVDFGQGPQLLDLDPGDRAEFLSSNNPSSSAREFHSAVIALSLKSLDIPYSFYDESHTNFFGSRAAWLHYERSCIDKRDDQIEMRDEYTRWKLFGWVITGRLSLPPGVTIDQLVWEWVPRGMPWWDPSKEINGDLLAVGAGFDNAERVVKRTGHGDIYDNIRANCRVIKAAEEIGQEILGRPFRLSFDPEASGGAPKEMELVEAIQKVYLGVGKVITVAEAREILNQRFGISLDPDTDLEEEAQA